MTDQRQPTELDRIAEEWVDTLCDLDPDYRVWLGRDGDVTGYGDLSPEGHAAWEAAATRTLSALDAATAVDDVDRVTQADLTAELRLAVETSAARWHLRDLNNIASPAQALRDVYDLMPAEAESDWATIAAKLGNLGGALQGYRETLRQGIREGHIPARRQIDEVITQAERNAGDDGFFVTFATVTAPTDLPESLRNKLRANSELARSAYGEFADFLRDE
ncbi:MAG: DUF885 family protein, partial [Actinobacteria bacterium]|nr:DUF885 family protein [Actinomycetota bacterium]